MEMCSIGYPIVSNLSFAEVEGEQLMRRVAQEIAVSSGSACTSATASPSHVLKHIGLPESLALCLAAVWTRTVYDRRGNQ